MWYGNMFDRQVASSIFTQWSMESQMVKSWHIVTCFAHVHPKVTAIDTFLRSIDTTAKSQPLAAPFPSKNNGLERKVWTCIFFWWDFLFWLGLSKKKVMVRSHRITITGPFATSSGCSSAAGRLDEIWRMRRLHWDLGSGDLDWDAAKSEKVFFLCFWVGQWRPKPFADEGSFHSSLPWWPCST